LLPRDQLKNIEIRLMVRPGTTGWAQVNGGILFSPDEKQRLDEFYVRNASLWLDLRIVVMTALMFFRGDRRTAHVEEPAWTSLIQFNDPAAAAHRRPARVRAIPDDATKQGTRRAIRRAVLARCQSRHRPCAPSRLVPSSRADTGPPQTTPHPHRPAATSVEFVVSGPLRCWLPNDRTSEGRRKPAATVNRDVPHRPRAPSRLVPAHRAVARAPQTAPRNVP
jgi:hypothetical protein